MTQPPGNDRESVTEREANVGNRYFRGCLIAALLGFVVLVILLVPAIFAAREAGIRIQRINGLRQVMLALMNYHDTNSALPDATRVDAQGQPLYSWRVCLVPYLEAIPGLDLQAAWDSPQNKKFGAQTLRFYKLGKDRAESTKFLSDVSAVVGEQTGIRARDSMRLAEVRFDTILVIEMLPAAPHWMAPGDISPTEVIDCLMQQSAGDNFLVGFADREVWLLDASVPPHLLIEFLTNEGDTQRDRETMLGPYKILSSPMIQ
ncbi:MAG TPA: DUF1559 domain-containing protein [Pirellulaceae bacterium]|nr:DUF1559 domain-containing protein [Pirellulaceae bacterium]